MQRLSRQSDQEQGPLDSLGSASGGAEQVSQNVEMVSRSDTLNRKVSIYAS